MLLNAGGAANASVLAGYILQQMTMKRYDRHQISFATSRIKWINITCLGLQYVQCEFSW